MQRRGLLALGRALGLNGRLEAPAASACSRAFSAQPSPSDDGDGVPVSVQSVSWLSR